MGVNTFLATTSHGLARATPGSNNEWQVEFLLTEQDVRCLAADSLHPEVI